MGRLLMRRPARPTGDAGFTIVELMVAMVILAIALSALASALVSGLVATSRAAQRTEAKQIAAKEIEGLHSIKWALVGLYTNEVGAAWGSGFHNGESIVKLADTPPSPRPADAPLFSRQVSGHGGKQYTVTTWVTWAGSSTSSPNDGTTFAKKRLFVDVSYTPRGGSPTTVHVEDFRAPTPLEMRPPPPAGGAVAISLQNAIFTPAGQQLTTSGMLTSAEAILVDTTAIGTDVTAVVNQSDGTPISIALTPDATQKHWTGTLAAGAGPFAAGSLQVQFTAHSTSGIVANLNGAINLTSPVVTPFQLTGATSNPVNQTLNPNNTLAQAITVQVGSSTPASSVTLQWKLSDGTVSGSQPMTLNGSIWTYTVPAGSGPFVPGNVIFTMTGTSSSGTTASTTSTVSLAATALGQIAVANVSWAPTACVDKQSNGLVNDIVFTIEVKNLAPTDPVKVSFQSLGYFPTSTSTGTKGPNGGYIYNVTLSAGTNVPPPSFDFFVTATRAADGSVLSPYYTTVPVATNNGQCNKL